MTTPLRIQIDVLELENFRSYVGGPHRVWLSRRGLVRLSGVNLDAPDWSNRNGVGKSGLLDGIEWVLRGTTPRRESADAVVPDGTKLPVRGKMWLHDERIATRYVIERGRKGASPSLQFLVFPPGAVEPVDRTCAKIDDTQARIDQALGLQADVWRATTYWAQDDGFDFAGARDAERKAMLAKLLPELGEVSKLAGVVKDLQAAVALEVQGAEKNEAGLSGKLQVMRTRDWITERASWESARLQRLSSVSTQIGQLDAHAKVLGDALQTKPVLLAAIEATAAFELEQHAVRRVREAEAALAQFGPEQPAPQPPLPVDVQAYQAEVKAASQADAEAARAEQQADGALLMLARELDELQALDLAGQLQAKAVEIAKLEAGVCDGCERPGFHGPSHATKLAAAQADNAKLVARSLAVGTRIAELPSLIAQAQAHAQTVRASNDQARAWRASQLAARSEQVGQYRAAQEGYQALSRSYAHAQQGRSSWTATLQQATSERDQARARLTHAMAQAQPDPRGGAFLQGQLGQMQAHEQELGRLVVQREQLVKQQALEQDQTCPLDAQAAEAGSAIQLLEAHLLEVQTALAGYRIRLEDLTWWREACGAQELPSLVLASRVQEITDAMNHGVRQLTAGHVWVSLGAVSQTKGGELRDRTTLYVHRQRPDGSVSTQEFESYSGGEKDRIRLGVARGLAIFASQGLVSPFDILLIDEAFSANLDSAGREAAARLVRDMAQDRGTVVFVTHEGGFGHLAASEMVVEKLGGASRIIHGAAP